MTIDSTRGFQHEALLYPGESAFTDVVVPFVQSGLDNEEAVLVVTSPPKIDALKAALGGRAASVEFQDMGRVGANPALIIPAWRRFVDDHSNTRMRGVGEPISAARSGAELVECQLHEALLNVAFAGVNGFRLACPYDTESLLPDVLEEAARSHPYLTRQGVTEASSGYASEVAGFRSPLPAPPAGAEAVIFGAGDHRAVRRWLASRLSELGMTPARSEEMVLAVHEAVVNSMMHGAGNGWVRLWREEQKVVCDVEDLGWIDDPLIGRKEPDVITPQGRGLWLANHLCDLVQIRSLYSGTVVRLHKALT